MREETLCELLGLKWLLGSAAVGAWLAAMSHLPTRGIWVSDLLRLAGWLLLRRLLSGIWRIDFFSLTAIAFALCGTGTGSVTQRGLLLCCLFLLRMLADGSAELFALCLLRLAWLPGILLTGGWLLVLLLPAFAREDGLYRRLYLKPFPLPFRYKKASTIR